MNKLMKSICLGGLIGAGIAIAHYYLDERIFYELFHSEHILHCLTFAGGVHFANRLRDKELVYEYISLEELLTGVRRKCLT